MSRSTNPFDDSSNMAPIKSYTNTPNHTIEDDVSFYEREIEKYMQESLDSTQRSRQQLEHSEQVGIATAQDLLEQREKLERTNANLDEIDRTTAQTQRNLNSLISVFGGFFKNKFSRSPKDPPANSQMSSSKSETALKSTISGLSGNGLPHKSTAPTLSENSRAAIQGTRWEAMDEEIDQNLDAMSANLSRLKMLGSDLGKEVEDQNRLLDEIGKKAEKNDATIRSQDHQMKKILGMKGVAKPTDSAGLVPMKK